MKNKIMIVVIAILSVVVLISLLQKDLWDVNEELLKDEVLSVEESIETVNLLDITPFEWDIVYSFDPYTPKDTIYETVGYKWDRVSETVNEGMNQIVFLNEEKVVCYLYGYPQNNGYGIFFTSENETSATSSVLSIKDDLVFDVIRSEDVVILSNN